MKEYTVRVDCEIARVWREKGETIWLTDEQASELVEPLGNLVSLKSAPVEDEEDAGLDGNKRGNGKAGD